MTNITTGQVLAILALLLAVASLVVPGFPMLVLAVILLAIARFVVP